MCNGTDGVSCRLCPPWPTPRLPKRKNLRQTGVKPHPCSVRHFGPLSQAQRVVRRLLSSLSESHSFPLTLAIFCLAFALGTLAQTTGTGNNLASSSSKAKAPTNHIQADPPGLLYQGVPAPIPQDEGAAGLRLELSRLGTTARLMQVVAHPDDEDGGMLTLQARGHGVATLLMTLNRGEGGQNKIGSNLSDVLGVLRAEELLASDQYYGVRERFSRVADFGFSKTADETFPKWCR